MSTPPGGGVLTQGVVTVVWTGVETGVVTVGGRGVETYSQFIISLPLRRYPPLRLPPSPPPLHPPHPALWFVRGARKCGECGLGSGAGTGGNRVGKWEARYGECIGTAGIAVPAVYGQLWQCGRAGPRAPFFARYETEETFCASVDESSPIRRLTISTNSPPATSHS
eukprot:3317486-Prymnesium_polylepis.1